MIGSLGVKVDKYLPVTPSPHDITERGQGALPSKYYSKNMIGSLGVKVDKYLPVTPSPHDITERGQVRAQAKRSRPGYLSKRSLLKDNNVPPHRWLRVPKIGRPSVQILSQEYDWLLGVGVDKYLPITEGPYDITERGSGHVIIFGFRYNSLLRVVLCHKM
ncbi:hypothetical protein CEXT_377811 [Caerostris extrusa]|uniref:Uncharacterized protein n=1 Tax=Caerostris extrusa TaxID=172846 RepID=A0AAV4S2N2_CAEEX|nr:hypothetical protein CEXT_377811 [Caerostris extrusa]